MLRIVALLTLAFAVGLSDVGIVNANNDTQEVQFGFGIDYDNNVFLLDGRPFRYVSGSFHYFRAPRHYWRDRLRTMRAAGLNAISTYVEWSLHEPEPGRWVWSGDADLIEFINLAQQEDLLVLLRPGPYICAERDFGGFPYWLLNRVPDIKLRTKDPRYMNYVEIYLNQVLSKVKPYLRGNGGPIIMVQIENEYGSYKACDTEYTNKLREIFERHIENKALLFTTDGYFDNMLRCGYIPGVYTTVDFGSGVNATLAFQNMRRFQPRGPLVNSEFYPGWLTHWGEEFQRVNTSAVTKTLEEILSFGASVNIYMFYGGTNFGYSSGANDGDYTPQITSYDYDAPMTEAGDPTEKYFAMRNVINQFLPVPKIPLPVVSAKGDYGLVRLQKVIDLFHRRSKNLFVISRIFNDIPPTFEAIGGNPYLVLYETELPQSIADPAILNCKANDRALVYVDNELKGTLSRTRRTNSLVLENPYARNLKILVENQGHLNYGDKIHDFKGIFNVDIDDKFLEYWNTTAFRIDDVDSLRTLLVSGAEGPLEETGLLHKGPQFLRGEFFIDDEPLDTYLDTAGWGKGVAFVNGRNLGRYWPSTGPQITLYVPAPYLRKGVNSLVLLELEYVPQTRTIQFQSYPIFNGATNNVQ
ncbi:beta-galactosidase-like [Prorops nasuta]|uniref:beta-galactosidase-like n=1 Tax=Prorops nasuta TaxID=863751 RepID=UPI0034CF56A3